MSELRLVGLNDDGDQVVLEGPDGQRFTLPIDDALRAAVRRDRPQLVALRAHASAALPPREMQARIRAGATAAEVADAAGVAVEIVERYEGPVLAERDWIAGQARETRIGHDTGAPTLGDLVTDRLATRGVAPGTVRWDAAREGTAPWTVRLDFEVGDDARTARWSFDPAARTVHALDDEARWLSETELADQPIPRRHLAAVRLHEIDTDVEVALRPVLDAVDAPAEPEEEPDEPDPLAATEALLDDLHGKRGVRQPLEEDLDDDADDFEGFGPQHAFDFDHPGLTAPPAAHPPASVPEEATDATVIALPSPSVDLGSGDDADAESADEAAADGDGTPGDEPGGMETGAGPEPGATDLAAARSAGESRSRGRRGRASVPSWDEIVFGAKPE